MSLQTSAPLAAAVGASPNLSLDEAGAIALGLFGLRASRVSSLGSCQDANFRIRVAVQPAATGTGTGGSSAGQPRTASFVLKVSNVAFAEPELDLQNLAMQHLAQRLHEQTQARGQMQSILFIANYSEYATVIMNRFSTHRTIFVGSSIIYYVSRKMRKYCLNPFFSRL
jgi:hypothetical protein